ncbi:MAG TPA: glycoside hydrolase family 130 protein [Dongiaceae bacterium]|nr:glycoside hydrolase family 130 protein [Dongiaceae bacterium]
MPFRRSLVALAAACALALPLSGAQTARAEPVRSPFTPWQRVSAEPLLTPRGDGFEAAGVFNPAVVEHRGATIMLYRAQDAAGVSRIGYASSSDGVRFTRRAAPVLSPQTYYETDGVEDPRVVRAGDVYYMTYTGYSSAIHAAQLCLATSTDLVHWDRKGIVLPAGRGRWNAGWTKSGAILPERVHGKYWMYYMGERGSDPPAQMGIAVSDDLVHWTDALDRPVMETRAGAFDARVVEPGPPPVMTDAGILLVYNGASDFLIYSTGWALFDKNDPAKLVARSDTPIFAAFEPWERTGQVPYVVFVEGLVRDGDVWTFYYGGADKTIGAARTRLRAARANAAFAPATGCRSGDRAECRRGRL